MGMDTDITLDALDTKALNDVMQAVRTIQSENAAVRIDRIEFVIYNEHRITATRRGRWQPLVIRKMRKVGR